MHMECSSSLKMFAARGTHGLSVTATLRVQKLTFSRTGRGLKVHSWGDAGFSLPFHLPGFHFGPIPICEPHPEPNGTETLR